MRMTAPSTASGGTEVAAGLMVEVLLFLQFTGRIAGMILKPEAFTVVNAERFQNLCRFFSELFIFHGHREFSALPHTCKVPCRAATGDKPCRTTGIKIKGRAKTPRDPS